MRSRLVFAIALLMVMGLGARYVGVAAGDRVSQATPQARGQSQGMPDMMKMHEQMMAEMKAADARLDMLVKEMNAASGNAKVTAMAAVVNELVAQHKSMHERMGQMHQGMVGRGMMMNR